MKHIFLVNPKAGGGSNQKAVGLIADCCKKRALEYEIIVTQYPNHAKELASNYSVRDHVCLYSVGGDGTAYEILNGLNDRVPLCILPCGTGNDFYRMINETIPDSLKQRIEEAIDGKFIEADYGLSNHTRFLNCTTIGFDAEINHLVNIRMKKLPLPAKLMYLCAAITKMVAPPKHHIRFEIDGKMIEQDVLLAAIMNGRYYGGGFNPTPEADLQDGLFDLCIVEPMSRRRMLSLISLYMKGQHTHLKECKMLRGRHIVIELEKPTVMQSDGEDFSAHQMTLDLMHKTLLLKVPQRSALN